MQTHITQTIETLSQQIDALTRTRNSLLEIFGPLPEPVLCSAPGTVAPPTTKPGANGKTSNQKSTATKAPRRCDAGARNTAIAASLSEPITSITLAKALGLTRNGGCSQIRRWESAGWLKRVGFGQYQRTAKFLAAKSENPNPPPHTVTIPGLDPVPKGTLSEQLEKALKDRDAATVGGHIKLAKILQDKVDKLTQQLG